jgi:hypothetical protein
MVKNGKRAEVDLDQSVIKELRQENELMKGSEAS